MTKKSQSTTIRTAIINGYKVTFDIMDKDYRDIIRKAHNRPMKRGYLKKLSSTQGQNDTKK